MSPVIKDGRGGMNLLVRKSISEERVKHDTEYYLIFNMF